MARTRKAVQVTEYTASYVWAAAAAATRINGGKYLKVSDNSEYGPARRRNRDLMSDFLTSGAATAEDIEHGDQVRSYYQGLLLKQLAGKITPFETAALLAASKDTLLSTDSYNLAIIASLPASQVRSVKRAEAKEKLDEILEKSQHIGKVGERLELDVKVLTCIFSHNYYCYFVTALAGSNVVFFANRTQLDKDSALHIVGTVKRHKDSGQTQLNRVRIM